MSRNTTKIIAAAGGAVLSLAFIAGLATAQERDGGRDGGPRGERVERLFERFDSNGDGNITRAEVLAEAAAHFAEADTDGNGKLSVAEIVAHRQARQAERLTERVERSLAWRDTDGDGELAPAEMGGDRLAGMFARMDANADGVISRAEAEDARPGRGRGRFGRRGGHGGN